MAEVNFNAKVIPFTREDAVQMCIKGIRMLERKEFELYGELILDGVEDWWLESDETKEGLMFVDLAHKIHRNALPDDKCGLRPVVEFMSDTALAPGSLFVYDETVWTVLTSYLAICNTETHICTYSKALEILGKRNECLQQVNPGMSVIMERTLNKGNKLGIIGGGVFGSGVAGKLRNSEKTADEYREIDPYSLAPLFSKEVAEDIVSGWDMALVACDHEDIEETMMILEALKSRGILTVVFAKNDGDREEVFDRIGKYSDTVFTREDMTAGDCAEYIRRLTETLAEGIVGMEISDMRAVFENKGNGLIGIAAAKGEGRALVAVKNAMEAMHVNEAACCFAGLSGEVGMSDFADVQGYIRGCLGEDIDIIQCSTADDPGISVVSAMIILTGIS